MLVGGALSPLHGQSACRLATLAAQPSPSRVTVQVGCDGRRAVPHGARRACSQLGILHAGLKPNRKPLLFKATGNRAVWRPATVCVVAHIWGISASVTLNHGASSLPVGDDDGPLQQIPTSQSPAATGGRGRALLLGEVASPAKFHLPRGL